MLSAGAIILTIFLLVILWIIFVFLLNFGLWCSTVLICVVAFLLLIMVESYTYNMSRTGKVIFGAVFFIVTIIIITHVILTCTGWRSLRIRESAKTFGF